MSKKFNRYLNVPKSSFFLLGPRGTGKSTWLQENLSPSLYIDLLESERFLELSVNPGRLRELCLPLQEGDWVVIDEVQKIPGLLDEVHWLYQKKKLHFAITGSSARKLKHSHANLLAGRLLDIRFFPLTYPELGAHFDLEKCLTLGTLPGIASQYEMAIPKLASYLSTYIRQELLEEAIIRKLDPFRRFLDLVGVINGQLLNKEAVARESGIKRPTVDHYFEILEDTLIGNYVEAFKVGLKSKESSRPKFYLFDTGVVRACAGLLNQNLETEYLGFMFETFILGQIQAYLNQNFKYFRIFHYSVSQSYDIDFLIQTKKPVMTNKGELVCIEVKYGRKFRSDWIHGLKDFRTLCKQKVKSCHVIYGGSDRMEIEGIQIWPTGPFLAALFKGEIL
ncbi:MAG: ATP-binding protein [Oligoflexales bacterium]